MSWYYLVVIISLLCLAGLFFPGTTRVVSATAFVLLWGTNLLPLDYQRACVRPSGFQCSAFGMCRQTSVPP